MTQQLKNAIYAIVQNNYRTDDCFDSHAVINEILQNKEYHKLYLDAWTKQDGTQYSDVRTYHSQISTAIKETGLVKDISDNFVSHTIYANLSPNKLWQKL